MSPSPVPGEDAPGERGTPTAQPGAPSCPRSRQWLGQAEASPPQGPGAQQHAARPSHPADREATKDMATPRSRLHWSSACAGCGCQLTPRCPPQLPAGKVIDGPLHRASGTAGPCPGGPRAHTAPLEPKDRPREVCCSSSPPSSTSCSPEKDSTAPPCCCSFIKTYINIFPFL